MGETRFTEANVNDCVLVKLTPFGEQLWAAYWRPALDRISSLLHKYPTTNGIPDDVRHVDEEGRTEFQMWQLMAIFGEAMYNGQTQQPFVDNKIWYPVREATPNDR